VIDHCSIGPAGLEELLIVLLEASTKPGVAFFLGGVLAKGDRSLLDRVSVRDSRGC